MHTLLFFPPSQPEREEASRLAGRLPLKEIDAGLAVKAKDAPPPRQPAVT